MGIEHSLRRDVQGIPQPANSPTPFQAFDLLLKRLLRINATVPFI